MLKVQWNDTHRWSNECDLVSVFNECLTSIWDSIYQLNQVTTYTVSIQSTINDSLPISCTPSTMLAHLEERENQGQWWYVDIIPKETKKKKERIEIKKKMKKLNRKEMKKKRKRKEIKKNWNCTRECGWLPWQHIHFQPLLQIW